MGKPAATIGHMHVCPKFIGNVPHVGGPIVLGSANVLIGGIPAARKGDMMVCVGPPDSIKSGSGTVKINGKPAARLSDDSSHGGKIVVGNPTVLIGG
ncbi:MULTISPECIES: PAAR domain-containing protein [unclassified Pseudoalteromonas]|uniref:PAAR domain-containing protein n=1 Tax=unclassified Pseudoalteromonas TaxID=194690 RepID=UPI00387061F7